MCTNSKLQSKCNNNHYLYHWLKKKYCSKGLIYSEIPIWSEPAIHSLHKHWRNTLLLFEVITKWRFYLRNTFILSIYSCNARVKDRINIEIGNVIGLIKFWFHRQRKWRYHCLLWKFKIKVIYWGYAKIKNSTSNILFFDERSFSI